MPIKPKPDTDRPVSSPAERQQRWDIIFKYGSRQARRRKLRESDIDREIQRYRARKNS
jgi:hypothetical protein